MYILNLIVLQAGGGGAANFNLILLAAMFLVMYFFLLRPQMKKQKQEKAYAKNVKVGDKIITKGGIHGKITRMDDDNSPITLSIDKNTNILLERAYISMEMSQAYYGSNNTTTEASNKN